MDLTLRLWVAALVTSLLAMGWPVANARRERQHNRLSGAADVLLEDQISEANFCLVPLALSSSMERLVMAKMSGARGGFNSVDLS